MNTRHRQPSSVFCLIYQPDKPIEGTTFKLKIKPDNSWQFFTWGQCISNDNKLYSKINAITESVKAVNGNLVKWIHNISIYYNLSTVFLL